MGLNECFFGGLGTDFSKDCRNNGRVLKISADNNCNVHDFCIIGASVFRRKQNNRCRSFIMSDVVSSIWKNVVQNGAFENASEEKYQGSNRYCLVFEILCKTYGDDSSPWSLDLVIERNLCWTKPAKDRTKIIIDPYLVRIIIICVDVDLVKIWRFNFPRSKPLTNRHFSESFSRKFNFSTLGHRKKHITYNGD